MLGFQKALLMCLRACSYNVADAFKTTVAVFYGTRSLRHISLRLIIVHNCTRGA